MLHHVSFGTNDLNRARAFYDAVFAVLGLRCLFTDEKSAAYGSSTFLFSLETPTDGKPASAGNGTHICFAAESRAMVDQFHQTALAHGGRDAGAPGIRPKYDDHYYGAFVFDPDGNKLEAVTFMSK